MEGGEYAKGNGAVFLGGAEVIWYSSSLEAEDRCRAVGLGGGCGREVAAVRGFAARGRDEGAGCFLDR